MDDSVNHQEELRKVSKSKGQWIQGLNTYIDLETPIQKALTNINAEFVVLGGKQ
jgi:hypothetical protein